MMTTPAKTDWHVRPEDCPNSMPCPVCGCPYETKRGTVRLRSGEHRAVDPKEGKDAKWIRRSKCPSGWEYIELTPSTKTVHRGPNRETIARIETAAAVLARGGTQEEAAAAAGWNGSAFRGVRHEYADVWSRVCESAMDKLTVHVREAAGTDAVLEDPDRFLNLARSADKWTRARGETLFPFGDKPTLSTFYSDYYRPNCLGSASFETVRSYNQVVRRWVLLTGDPPLEDISVPVLGRFRDCLARMRGLKRGSKRSVNSIRTILRHLQAILDKAGPAGPRNRDAAEIIKKAPYIKPPREEVRVPRIAPLQHLEQVYLATAGADVPWVPGIKPPQWWRALLVVTLYTGFRRRTLFSLRMTDIRWDDQCIIVGPGQMKRGVGNLVPLNRVALEHLMAIRTDRELVFPWANQDGIVRPWNANQLRRFCEAFKKLQTAAGLPASDHFGLHAIRKTHGTLMWDLSPEAAQLSLGHSTSQTTTKHYVAGMGIVRKAIEGLPTPDTFCLLAR